MEPGFRVMWWGPAEDGAEVHLFESLWVAEGSQVRTGPKGFCGWEPLPVMEGFTLADLPGDRPGCSKCRDAASPLMRIEQIRECLERANPPAHPGGERVFGDMRFLLEQVDKLHAHLHSRQLVASIFAYGAAADRPKPADLSEEKLYRIRLRALLEEVKVAMNGGLVALKLGENVDQAAAVRYLEEVKAKVEAWE